MAFVVSATLPLHTLADEVLIDLARGGHPDAFMMLWGRYLPRLRRQALSAARNADLAEDLLQDTCVKAFQALPRLAPGSTFGKWAATILARTWIDCRRHMLRFQLAPAGGEDEPGTAGLEELPDETASPCDHLLRQETRREMRDALERLEREHPELAEAVRLHVFLDLPFVELEGNAATWRSRYLRARAKLASYFQEQQTAESLPREGRGRARSTRGKRTRTSAHTRRGWHPPVLRC